MFAFITITLNPSQSQILRLEELQSTFSAACNYLSPIVASNNCWNRVALHHLAYRKIREKFPQLGSQMSANVIYSVCRAAKKIYQDPLKNWHSAKKNNLKLPILKFPKETPVFFDRHTLSIKKNKLSLYSLDGRMKFEIEMNEKIEYAFINKKLNEIILYKVEDKYKLRFSFETLEVIKEQINEDLNIIKNIEVLEV